MTEEKELKEGLVFNFKRKLKVKEQKQYYFFCKHNEKKKDSWEVFWLIKKDGCYISGLVSGQGTFNF